MRSRRAGATARRRAARRTTHRPLTVGLTAGLVASVLVTAPAAQAAPAAPAQTAPTQPTCIGANLQPGDADAAPFLMPAWADGAGWSDPAQYRTITSGDIDGDGKGELVGRNGGTVAVFTWDVARPEPGPWGKYDNPVPGQWRELQSTGRHATDIDASWDLFSTAGGGWDPSRYETIQLADVDGDGADDLIGRWSDAVGVYRWNAAENDWTVLATGNDTLPEPGPTWADRDSQEPDGSYENTDWGQEHPDHYRTITSGDVDGTRGAEIIGRASDGVHSFSWDKDTQVWIPRGGPELSDALGYTAPDKYDTIMVIDVDADLRDEIVYRSTDGLGYQVADYDGANWQISPAATPRPFPDADPATSTAWTDELYWSSLTHADVDADGREDLVGRSNHGLEAWGYNPDGTWRLIARQDPASPDALSGSRGWDDPQYASTVQGANVDPHAGDEVIARGTYGVEAFAVEGGVWKQVGGTIGQFSNANGWGDVTATDTSGAADDSVPADLRYSTIQPVTVQDGELQLVIGRDRTGIRTLGPGDADPSATFPDYTNLITPDGPIDNAIPLYGLEPPLLQQQLDDLTPAGRAFWYLDARAAQDYWQSAASFDTPNGPVTPDRPTIVDELRNQQVDLFALQNALKIYSPNDWDSSGVGSALNVDRATFMQVRQDTIDWTGSAARLRLDLLGAQGAKNLLEQSFVSNLGQVENVKQAFEVSNKRKLWALIADLVGGLVGGAISGGAAFVGPESTWTSFVLNIAGSGLSAAVGAPSTTNQNPNLRLDAEADQLQAELVSSFCAAGAYIDWSNDFIVQDLGLLTAVDDTLLGTSPTSTTFSTIVAELTSSQDLWIWQQFANVGPETEKRSKMFWLGYCTELSGCGLDNSKDWYPAPEDSHVNYQLLHGDGNDADCSHSVLGDTSTFGAFNALNADPRLWAAPRKTDAHNEAGHPMSTNDVMGEGGWQLKRKKCN